MKNRYEFMCMIDDNFKECETTRAVSFRFREMQNILVSLFNQNIELKVAEDKKRNK